MHNKELLSVKNVTKKYTRNDDTQVTALSDIDLTVYSGEILAIIGPSGCGKSTLLRILAGLDTDYAGTVDLLDNGEDSLGSHDIGFVFQTPTLLPWRSVRKNVELGLEARKIDKSEQKKRVDELLHLTGLYDFANSLPGELSGGMQQRVAIIRALAYNPSILLMDEPFGALDHITRENLQDDLLDIWKQTGKTIIIVTHAVDEATYLADRVCVLSSRPGEVKSIHEVPLKRPRTAESKTLPEYTQFQKVLREELRDGII